MQDSGEELASPASRRVEGGAGCGGGRTVAIGDGNRRFLVEAVLANSGLCGLRQNPNYFQLRGRSGGDSCPGQGFPPRLRPASFFAGFAYLRC